MGVLGTWCHTLNRLTECFSFPTARSSLPDVALCSGWSAWPTNANDTNDSISGVSLTRSQIAMENGTYNIGGEALRWEVVAKQQLFSHRPSLVSSLSSTLLLVLGNKDKLIEVLNKLTWEKWSSSCLSVQSSYRQTDIVQRQQTKRAAQDLKEHFIRTMIAKLQLKLYQQITKSAAKDLFPFVDENPGVRIMLLLWTRHSLSLNSRYLHTFNF